MVLSLKDAIKCNMFELVLQHLNKDIQYHEDNLS